MDKKISAPSITEALQNGFPFWQKLQESERQKLADGTVAKHFQKGENVHGADGRCTGAILVQSGAIRVYIMSQEGREITLYRLQKGDVCVLSASCVLQCITFDVLADAETAADCLVIPGALFKNVTDANVWAKNYMLETAVKRFSDVMWVMQQILFFSLDKRIAIFLANELQKSGSPTLHLTKEQIARDTGSAREAVSRMLKYFAGEGILTSGRGRITIKDPEKLKRLTV